MDARKQFWERHCAGQPVSSAYLTAYGRDLNTLRKIAAGLDWTMSRICLREATVRLMAGAAPGKTQHLLDKTLMQKTKAKGIICSGRGNQTDS